MGLFLFCGKGVCFAVSDAVLVALIGLCGSGLGSLFGVLVSSKLTQYRLEQLEKRVQAHNSLIERTYKLEGQMTEVQHDIRDMKGGRE